MATTYLLPDISVIWREFFQIHATHREFPLCVAEGGPLATGSLGLRILQGFEPQA